MVGFNVCDDGNRASEIEEGAVKLAGFGDEEWCFWGARKRAQLICLTSHNERAGEESVVKRPHQHSGYGCFAVTSGDGDGAEMTGD